MDLTKIEEAVAREERRAASAARGDAVLVVGGGMVADRAFLSAAASDMLAEIERLQQVDRDATAMLDDAAEKIGRLMMQVERLKTLAREGWEAARDAWETENDIWETEDSGDAERIAQAIKEIDAGEQNNDVLGDIIAERRAQDAKWGGPVHDDRHDAEDWIDRMARKLEQAHDLIGGEHSNDYIFRRRMVQAGALAVACVESLDRHCGKNGGVVR